MIHFGSEFRSLVLHVSWGEGTDGAGGGKEGGGICLGAWESDIQGSDGLFIVPR